MATPPELAWSSRWESSDTPWDHGQAAPALLELIDSNLVPSGPTGRALVPGCGSGYDVLALTRVPGVTTVVGVDLAPRAIQVAEEKRDKEEVPADRASFVAADFFTYAPGEPFDIIYDHTFLCALPPHLRSDWASKMAELTRPGGVLITYMFPLANHESGPPFALTTEIYEHLLSPNFVQMYIKDITSPFHVKVKTRGEKISIWKRK
ncbi:hypothetical protein HK104_010280 [Borealophlyctis nickersoniae]|nr:hypothetical protein HK104_010280 [Borealophlyctis nickersoniae]